MKTAHSITFDRGDDRLHVNCLCPVFTATIKDIHVWIINPKTGRSSHVGASTELKLICWEKLKTAALLFK